MRKSDLGGTVPFLAAGMEILQKMRRNENLYLFGTIPGQRSEKTAGYLADLPLFKLRYFLERRSRFSHFSSCLRFRNAGRVLSE